MGLKILKSLFFEEKSKLKREGDRSRFEMSHFKISAKSSGVTRTELAAALLWSHSSSLSDIRFGGHLRN
jgi:hypothetical protein